MGPDASTRHLLAAIRRLPLPAEPTLLDVGGGIGAIHHTLLDEGFVSATHLDMSPAYLDVAAAEAERRGHQARLTFLQGAFPAAADQMPPADVVTLDRVVCCERNVTGLLGAAAEHTQHLLALSYPQDRWYNHLVIATRNLWRWTRGNVFRTFVHSPAGMATVLESYGLRRRWSGGTWLWRVDLFERAA